MTQTAADDERSNAGGAPSSADSLIGEKPRERLKTLDIDHAAAAEFSAMSPTAKLEVYSKRLIGQITTEKESLKKSFDEANRQLDKLRVSEHDLIRLKVVHRKQRITEAIAGALSIVGGALISAYPVDSAAGLLWFSSPQLHALGWCFVLWAGGTFILKSAFDT